VASVSWVAKAVAEPAHTTLSAQLRAVLGDRAILSRPTRPALAQATQTVPVE